MPNHCHIAVPALSTCESSVLGKIGDLYLASDSGYLLTPSRQVIVYVGHTGTY